MPNQRPHSPLPKYFATLAVAGVIGLTGCESRTWPVAATPKPTASQTTAARERGIQEATAAIAEGKLKIKEYPPLPSPPGHGEYVKLLKEKCGVDYEVIGRFGFSEDLQAEVKGWNDTMRAEIQRRCGATIFQDLEKEALSRWEKK